MTNKRTTKIGIVLVVGLILIGMIGMGVQARAQEDVIAGALTGIGNPYYIYLLLGECVSPEQACSPQALGGIDQTYYASTNFGIGTAQYAPSMYNPDQSASDASLDTNNDFVLKFHVDECTR